MHLLLWLAVFVVSLAVLVKSSDLFVASSERVGLFLGLPPFVVGVVIGAGWALRGRFMGGGDVAEVVDSKTEPKDAPVAEKAPDKPPAEVTPPPVEETSQTVLGKTVRERCGVPRAILSPVRDENVISSEEAPRFRRKAPDGWSRSPARSSCSSFIGWWSAAGRTSDRRGRQVACNFADR